MIEIFNIFYALNDCNMYYKYPVIIIIIILSIVDNGCLIPNN
jgi:hypothetical protein